MDEDEDAKDVGPGIVPDSGLIDVENIQVPASGKPTVDQTLRAFFNDPVRSS